MRFRVAFIIAVAALVAGSCAIGADIQIGMKRVARLPSGDIRLGDVASVLTPNAKLSETLAAVKLADTPWPGNARTFSRDYVAMVLKRHDVNADEIAWKGAETCTVTVHTVRVTGDEIVQAARSYLREAPVLKGKSVDMEAASRPRDITVAATERPRLVVSAPAMARAWGRAKVYVKIMDGRRQLAVVPVSFKVTSQASVLYAVRPVRRGAKISQDDVLVREITLGPGSGNTPYVTDKSMALGRLALRAIPAGTPLTLAMVVEPLAARRGEGVSIYLHSGSLQVTTKGIAQDDGRLGDVIGVKIAGTGKVISGKLTGRSAIELKM